MRAAGVAESVVQSRSHRFHAGRERVIAKQVTAIQSLAKQWCGIASFVHLSVQS